MAMVLDLLAATGEPLSALVDALPKFAMVKTKYPLGGSPRGRAIREDRRGPPRGEADRRDGLRLDWPDRWAHVRSSNTEPIVRVIAEARRRAGGPCPGGIPRPTARGEG